MKIYFLFVSIQAFQFMWEPDADQLQFPDGNHDFSNLASEVYIKLLVTVNNC